MTDKVQPNSITLTEDEVKLVTNLNQKKEKLTQEINYIAQQNIVLNYRQKVADKDYEDIVNFERQIVSSLTSKYGNGTIDIESGTFIPS